MTEAAAPVRPRGGAALVTGGAKRIGRAICLELAAAGFDLAIHHRESGEEAAEVARAVEAMGRRAVCLSADLADADATGARLGRAVEALGVAYATLQCAELLAGGAPGIHFYTLNRSPATQAILGALKLQRPWLSR